jgi:hypothetical protein
MTEYIDAGMHKKTERGNSVMQKKTMCCRANKTGLYEY